MTDAAPDGGVWRKSTASQPSGNCVEVAMGIGTVRIRNSRDRSGAVLSFSHAQWRTFLDSARNGEFNASRV